MNLKISIIELKSKVEKMYSPLPPLPKKNWKTEKNTKTLEEQIQEYHSDQGPLQGTKFMLVSFSGNYFLRHVK